MAVDLFDFDFWVHCFAEFVLEKGFSNIKVMSPSTGRFTVVIISGHKYYTLLLEQHLAHREHF
jgi:hypothetical protein